MSAYNGIYMLKTADGWRVAHLQCIDNIYWWPTCCVDFDISELPAGEDMFYHEKCDNCGCIDPEYERRDKINPIVIYQMFKNAKRLDSEEDAFNEADFQYCQVTKVEGGYVEYGIQKINGLEEWPFPEEGERNER